MNKKIIIWSAITAAIIILAVAIVYPGINTSGASMELENLAKCLADKNVVMYGAEWCSHCQNQKRMFDGAFKYVPYVECPDNVELCVGKGVEVIPTWIFPDGKRHTGELTAEMLAKEAGCEFQTAGK
ncbi:hypothetical protein A3I34_01280 [Candidatus Jorgensenbacteria bacterium RIFCSPLOWO2_02_FULL_45_12]|uniref:Thioredoxin domain-containing protein n=2 Tax=Candidatus Joergenseniibacteriota TaxID=1752739 RepID=A0A1F6BQZ3_9BACT|nr:MAG: hypothetical protein UX22_C0001G0041 [Candidatus Jorgensenbacteria bacterium GW2011_GWA2_45_9]OGG38967.1 MAG: hypothetical protein A3D55_03070 [Candidatus Jorgensenbacteria bacterium RIFCSPHIGHO2_02_FULL_45_20]OGG42726.1 MAG: hypothetical protein A3I34_01280 [Candidatus Jorgensenbacteria bacterium RIFCSPLOWO2_02_FULL_45_12]